MSTLYFQGRGPGFLQEIQADGSLKAGVEICLDGISIDMAVQGEWDHINKCGPVDVIDASGNTGFTANLNLTFANVEDKLFALGALGFVVPQGTPGSVVAEELPGDLADGEVWFLGGKTRHRAITGLTITGMTLTTDYTFDAASGRVTFVGDQSASPPPTASYGYTDPQYVSMLNAPTRYYMFSYEFMNRQAANDQGSLELYKIKLAPSSSIDFMTDKEQDMSIKGKALADTNRAFDGDLGQFGRRVL